MAGEIKRFILEKFWQPATGEAAPYNIYNTLVYALLFGAAAIYLVLPMLKKIGVKMDREFFLGVSPFIFLGGALRVLEDLQLVDSFLAVTPFIYIWMFLYTGIALVASKEIEKRSNYEYHKVFGALGLLPLAALLVFYISQGINFAPLILTLGIFAAATGAGYILLKQLKPELANWSFGIPVAAHYWDASSSVVILISGGFEKHVLAQAFVNLFGPMGMFVMKTAIIVPVTYLVIQDYDGEKQRYYLFLIALLGIALGTRNLLQMIVG